VAGDPLEREGITPAKAGKLNDQFNHGVYAEKAARAGFGDHWIWSKESRCFIKFL
jgi:hypothetical protein